MSTKNTNEILTEQFLKKYNLTLKEFLILYSIIIHKGSVFSETIQSLIDKKLIHIVLPIEDKPVANKILLDTDAGKEILKNCLSGSDPNINQNLEELAIKMKELFPKGSKTPGHPWRSNTKEVIDKLKRFRISYDFTDDQILEATALYVKIMQSNPYMRTLKHFIIKKVNEEIISDLASFIENDQQTIYERFDINYRPESTTDNNNLELF